MAPSEWPAMPTRERSSVFQNGLYGGVEALVHPPLLLARVARADAVVGVAAALLRHVRVLGVREEEVERVLGAVVEGLAGLRGHSLLPVRPGAEGVRAALALDVVGEDDVAVLGESRRQAPVERLRRLHRAGGDDDARPRRRARSRRPNGARERRAVARREQDGVHEAVALLLPVVEADVARALVRPVRADVGREVPRRVVGDDLRVLDRVPDVLLLQLGLELRRRGDVALALGDLGEVLGLLRGVKGVRARRRGEHRRAGRNQYPSPEPPHGGSR